MVSGFNGYSEDYTIGVNTGYYNKGSMLKLGVVADKSLSEYGTFGGQEGSISGSVGVGIGMGLPKEGRKSSQLEVTANADWIHDTPSGIFVGANAGVDASYNYQYDRDVDYGLIIGNHYTYNHNFGYPFVGITYGPYIGKTHDTGRSNKHDTFDVAASVGASVGKRDFADNRTYVFGSLNKEFTNKKNLSAQVGVGHSREMDVFGVETIGNFKLGYNKNFDGNTTHNSAKYSGVFAEAGVKFIF